MSSHAGGVGVAQFVRESLRRATIATRNTKYFEGLDVPVVDPWKF
jgi:hypothetical protein